ncbi:MAG: cysteine hydrolase family protein [Candidatus Hodarchaeales archaeon]
MRKKAILFIDMQLGNFQLPNSIFQSEYLIESASKILRHARKLGDQIIFIQNMGTSGDIDELGTNGWEIHPSIQPQKNELIVQKTTPDSFYQTRLDNKLRKKGINTLVILGLQTEYCVDTSVRRGFSLGYAVELIKDCHSTWDSNFFTAKQIIQHHNHILGDFFAKLISVDEFLKE